MDAVRFDAICSWLKAWFTVLPLDEAVQRLKTGALPERALSITFDDGYVDNHDVALPILLKHGLTATFFIATGFLDGGRMWNDTVTESIRRTKLSQIDLRGLHGTDMHVHPVESPLDKRTAIGNIIRAVKYMNPADRQEAVDALAERSEASLPDDLMMSSQNVCAMRAAGMQIGAHTVSHPILAGLNRDNARREIEEGKRVLEALVKAPVDLFAYPNGKPTEDYTDESVALAREAGFSAAVSTAPGASCAQTDVMQLLRFTPWDRDRLRFGARLGTNLWKSRQ